MNIFDVSSLPFGIFHEPTPYLHLEMQGRTEDYRAFLEQGERTFWRRPWYYEQSLNTFAAVQFINHHMTRTKF